MRNLRWISWQGINGRAIVSALGGLFYGFIGRASHSPIDVLVQGALNGPRGLALQGFLVRAFGRSFHKPLDVLIQGALSGPRGLALQGFLIEVLGVSLHKPLSVLIQGVLYGPLHTAMQGFIPVAEIAPRRKIPAVMPNFMRTRTRFRF